MNDPLNHRMKGMAMSATKVKVTVTLAPQILADLEEMAKENGLRSRSAALEKVLKDWQYAEDVRKLEEETIAYYDSMTDEEREEDRLFIEAAWKESAKVWKEDDPGV